MVRNTQAVRGRAGAKAPRKQLTTKAALKSVPGPVTWAWAGAASLPPPPAATSPSEEEEESEEESEASEEKRCSRESPVRGRGTSTSEEEEESEEESEASEEERCSRESPVRGRGTSTSEEEDEGESEESEEEEDEDSENLKEYHGTEQLENQAEIPSVEEVVGSLGSKLQEFVKAGSRFVLEMDSMRGREADEIDAVVKVALQMVSKSLRHSRQLRHSLVELQSAARSKRVKNRLSKAGMKAAPFPEQIELRKGAISASKRSRLNG